MMMLYRLVRLIETHAQALAASLLIRVQDSAVTPDYRNVPAEELKARVYEIYCHLGEWLIAEDKLSVEARYFEIGARRALQGVPLSQVVWAIILTKENLWDYIKRESILERPIEVLGELEMLQLLDQFFDRAIHYAAVGYERAVAEHGIGSPTLAAKSH